MLNKYVMLQFRRRGVNWIVKVFGTALQTTPFSVIVHLYVSFISVCIAFLINVRDNQVRTLHSIHFEILRKLSLHQCAWTKFWKKQTKP